MFHFLFLDLLPFSSVESATRKMMIVTESLPRCSFKRDKFISLLYKVLFSIGLLFSWRQWTMSLMRLESSWCPLLMRKWLKNMVRILENLKSCEKKIENLHHLTVRNFGVAHIGNVQKRRDGGHLRREYSGVHFLSCAPNFSCLKSHETSQSQGKPTA